MRSDRISVLFVCTHNSARSQMAEGLLNVLFGDRFEAFSAGTEPTSVHPLAIKAVAEIGIDISGHRPKSIEQLRDRELDHVITVCDRAHQDCPFFAGGRRQLHEGLGDPARAGMDAQGMLVAFRRTRDEMRTWLEKEFVPHTVAGGGGDKNVLDFGVIAPGPIHFRSDHKDG